MSLSWPKIDIRPDHWEIVRSILQKHVPQHAVWAFGSRAKWTAKEYSDLDLAIITDKPLSLDISASLSDDFSESDLPYKVDVVDWATTGESFRKIIERDKVVVQEAGLGWVMASDVQWFEKPLGEVTDNHDGKRRPVKESERKKGPFPYYGASGIVDYVDGYLFEGRYLLIAEDGENLRTRQTPIAFMADGKFWVNNHAHIVTGNDEVTTEYLHYFLQNADIQSYLTGAVMPKLTQGNLNRIPVRYPEPDYQKLIVQVLGSLDAKIDINRRINQTLEAMAQAIFKSWFVDYDPVKAKIAAKHEGRDPLRAAMSAISGKPDAELNALPPEQYEQLAATAALFPDVMEESELGDIPKGWSYKTLAQLTDKIGSGATPRGGKEVYLDEGVALIRSQNVYDSLFVWEGLARISDEAATQLKGVTVQADDVLLNITGASILRTCVVEPGALPARVNQHVAIIRAKAGIPPHFIHMHLLRPDLKSHLFGLNAGASREAITKSHIECLALLTPSPELLGAFQAATSPLFRQAQRFGQQIRILGELRDTLLPKLLSGELSVEAIAPTSEATA